MKKYISVVFSFILAFCIFSGNNLKVFAANTSIIGTDDRVPISNISQQPYASVVNIVAEFSSGPTSSTGFFISDDVVVTAAHCVYDVDRKEYAKSIFIYVPTKDNTWGGPYKIDRIKVSERYMNWTVDGQDLSGSLTEDYAALILNAPLDKEKHPNYWTSFKLTELTNGIGLNLIGVLPRDNGRTMYHGT